MKKFNLLFAIWFFTSVPIIGQSWHELYQAAENYYIKRNYSKALEFSEQAVSQAKKESGGESAEYATALNKNAMVLKALGDYSKAEPLYLKALDIRRNVLGQENPDYATSLNELAELYVNMGNYSKAEPLYIEALNIRKKVLGPEHPDYAITLNDLGELYYYLGNHTKAESFYLEALNIREKVLGPENLDYASSLEDLAVLYDDMAIYLKAESLYLDALKIKKKVLGLEHPDYATSLNNLALLYTETGNYSKAEPLYTEALDIRKRVLGIEHPDYAVSLNNLAALYNNTGNYSRAEPLYLEALKISKKVLGPENPDYAAYLNNLAGFYKQLGNYPKAEPLYLEALKIRKKVLGPEHPSYAISLNDLAGLYQHLGNYSKAEPLYLEALNIRKKVYGQEHPYYAYSLNNLAEFYDDLGDYSKAEPLYVESLNILKKVLGPEHPDYGTSLNNLAALYKESGDYSKAEPLLIEALNITKKALGTENPDYAIYLNNLAGLYEDLGNYLTAEPLYMQALNIQKKVLGPAHPDYAKTLNHLAGLYESLGDYSKAWSFIQSANDNLNNQIHNNFTFLSETQKEQFINNIINRNFESYNSFFLKRNSGDPSLAGVSYDNELAHKGLLLLSNTTLRQAVYGSNDSSLIRSYDHFRDIHQRLSLLYTQPISERKVNADSLENVSDSLEKSIMSRGKDLPGINDLKGPRRITWQEVQNALKPDEAAIEFVDFRFYNRKWTDSTFYCALVLRKGYKYPKMVYLFEEKQIKDIVSTPKATDNPYYINQIYTVRSNQGSNDKTGMTPNSLYQIVWQPIDSLLKNVKTIYIAPSGLLNKVAFNALAVSDSIFLIDTYNLVILGSTRALVGNKRDDFFITGDSKVALFGGIEYDADSMKLVSATRHYNKSENELPVSRSLTASDEIRGEISWPYLEGTLTEVTDISKLFKSKQIDAAIFTGADATRESFESLSESKKSPEIIHIATHGFFFQNQSSGAENKQKSGSFSPSGPIYTHSVNPLFRSGILFAGASRVWKNLPPIQGVEDGNLTAFEVSNMNFSNTRLVVLSACETGLGDIKGSEGVYGLRRAFKMAGVQYTIMSLWQVPDYQTSELMKLFYSNCLSGMTIREGFKTAQIIMHKKYEPFYWAAFELME